MSREKFLDTPIGQLQDFALALECQAGCDRPATVSLKELAARYERRPQLRIVVARLKCTYCKRPPASVSICDHVSDGQAATWRVELVP